MRAGSEPSDPSAVASTVDEIRRFKIEVVTLVVKMTPKIVAPAHWRHLGGMGGGRGVRHIACAGHPGGGLVRIRFRCRCECEPRRCEMWGPQAQQIHTLFGVFAHGLGERRDVTSENPPVSTPHRHPTSRRGARAPQFLTPP